MVEPTAFAPRKKLLAYFEEGWRLLPGHEYHPSDWAILVYMPTYPKPVPMELMKRWALRFQTPERPAISNNRSAWQQGRPRPNGSKLKPEQVAEIRRRLADGEKQWRIAQRYGVSRDTICLISTGRTWAGQAA